MSRRDAMTPEIERELEALDRALDGEAADAQLAALVAAVQEQRPAPRAEFAAGWTRRSRADSAAASPAPKRPARGPRRPAAALAPSPLPALGSRRPG